MIPDSTANGIACSSGTAVEQQGDQREGGHGAADGLQCAAAVLGHRLARRIRERQAAEQRRQHVGETERDQQAVGLVLGAERAVGLADRGEQAVERPHDGDRERGNEQIVPVAKEGAGALGRDQAQERVRHRNLAAEMRHRLAEIRTGQHARDGVGEGGPERDGDHLGRRLRPAVAHEQHHADRASAEQHRPRIHVPVLAGTAAVRTQDLGQLFEDERKREAGHEPRHDRVGHEAREIPEAQHAERDLQHAREREARRGEQHDVARRHLLHGGEVQDESGEHEHGRGARHLVRQQRRPEHERAQVAEEGGGEGGAHAGTDRGVALALEHDRSERDEAERQHQREQHERGRDAVRDLARGLGGVQRGCDIARGVIGHGRSVSVAARSVLPPGYLPGHPGGAAARFDDAAP